MTTVPCAAGVATDCRGELPLGEVEWRDADAAAICEPCADELDLEGYDRE